MIKGIEDKEYTMKLLVKQANVEKMHKTYLVTDIFKKNDANEVEDINVTPQSQALEDSSDYVTHS